MKEIVFSDQAKKFLRKITVADAQKIIGKIKQYATAPETLKNQVKRLQGTTFYRLRIGDYRAIFDEDGTVLSIIKIGKRGDVYRGV